MIEIGYSSTGDIIEMYSNDNQLHNYLLRNADYDYTEITANTKYPFDELTSKWTHDTLLLAEFKNNCNASNVDFSVENTSELLIKRRKKNSLKWYVVYVQSISSPKDFNFTVYDKFAAGNTLYEYAITPIINGAQGETITQELFSDFCGDRILDTSICYKNVVKDVLNYSRYNSTGTINTMIGKYAYVINNSENNYNHGSYSTTFLRVECDRKQEDYMKDFQYRSELVDFLTNHKAKVLKKFTGEIFVIAVDGEVSTNDGDFYMLPETSFNWVEIGDSESNKDMYELGLNDVAPEWYDLVNSTRNVNYSSLLPSTDVDTSVLRWQLINGTNVPNNNSLTWNLL